MNFTNFSTGAMIASQKTEYTVGEVMQGFCAQIDSRILICLLLIFTFYVARTKMISISKYGMISTFPSHEKFIRGAFEQAESFFDTLALLASSFVIYLWVEQNGWNTMLSWWLGTLIVICVLAFIANKINKKTIDGVVNEQNDQINKRDQ